MNRQLKSNFSYAFIAQFISLAVSCITNLVLPKVFSLDGYSYWQLFIFYATYIPCFALGINDGVYLRYGGESRKSLNAESIKSQYVFGMIYQIFIASILGIVGCAVITNSYRRIILLLVLIYYIIYTSHNFLGYIFQAINETNKYSKSIILNKVFYLTAQIILLIIHSKSVFLFIPFYIISMGVALSYLMYKSYPIFKGTTVDLSLGFREGSKSMQIGISLMISNVCAMLVTGIGRQIIDMKWGLSAFGKVSFSLTLINFALSFFSQISMVLFPALRRLQPAEVKAFYAKLTKALYIILPFIYIVYVPAKYILELWLPNYSESINYLSVILPICFFDCKMNLIGNTFFKVLSKQVNLLKINLAMIAFSGVSGVLAAYWFENISMVIFGMVAAVILRSVIADIVLSKYVGIKVIKYEILDIALACIFILCANLLNAWLAFAILAACAILRICFISLKSIK